MPSQKGLLPLCLQPHNATGVVEVMVTLSGVNSVSLWESSQKGWLADLPQAHHQYLPGASCKIYGDFFAILGSAMSDSVVVVGIRRINCLMGCNSLPPVAVKTCATEADRLR